MQFLYLVVRKWTLCKELVVRIETLSEKMEIWSKGICRSTISGITRGKSSNLEPSSVRDKGWEGTYKLCEWEEDTKNDWWVDNTLR